MTAKITPSELSGQINVPSSKSYTHRLIIAVAFLSLSDVKISNVVFSEDVFATIDCLTKLGAKIIVRENSAEVVVSPIKTLPKSALLDVKSSASTLRFLMPILAFSGTEADFLRSSGLKQRPLAPIKEVFNRCGIDVKDLDVLSVKSGNMPKSVRIDGSVSSQFVSGLMFAAAVAKKPCEIEVVGATVSKGYVDITIDVLKKFGVKVTENDSVYFVEKTDAPKTIEYTVEGDWSNAAYFLVGGALSKKGVTVCGLNIETLQRDANVLDVIKKVGAQVSIESGNITVKRDSLKPFSYNAENTPDLVPALAVLAANIKGESTISGVSRLKIKESDRLTETVKMLNAASIKTSIIDDVLKIYGGAPEGAEFCGASDHRMVMAETLLALYAKGLSKVTGVENVAKSYPNFFDDIKNLGGKNCVFVER